MIEGDLGMKQYQGNVTVLENLICDLSEKLKKVERENEKLAGKVIHVEEENAKLRSDLDMTKKQEDIEALVKETENVTKMKRNYKEWKKTHETETVNFRQTTKAQKQS